MEDKEAFAHNETNEKDLGVRIMKKRKEETTTVVESRLVNLLLAKKADETVAHVTEDLEVDHHLTREHPLVLIKSRLIIEKQKRRNLTIRSEIAG